MLVVIDVGNTNTVIGVYESPLLDRKPVKKVRKADTGLLHHFRVATVGDRTADELALLLMQLLNMKGVTNTTLITGIIASSTVPAVTQTMRDMAIEWFGVEALIVGPGIKSGMPILYDNAKEVGADRIADAVGGTDLYGSPLIVVDFGTATTFDAVSVKGEYLGGAICPGIEISLDALVSRAAALRKVELIAPRTAIGRSTVESIQAGAIFGFAAQTDGMVKRIKAEVGEPVTVIATGGLAGVVVPHCTEIDFVEPWLTLHGLRLLYEKNVLQ